jgi:hypothetical protein
MTAKQHDVPLKQTPDLPPAQSPKGVQLQWHRSVAGCRRMLLYKLR